jgi:opacity protein-like surface antigen
MKISLTFLGIGLAALVAAAGPAFAGDYNYGAGGLKGVSGGAVPVPAPIAIPESAAAWYLRADVGVDFGKNGKIGTDGYDYGLLSSFGSQGTNGVLRFGFGRYVTPTLRAELAIDLRNQQKVARDNRAVYQQTLSTPGHSTSVYNATTNTSVTVPAVHVDTYQFDRDQNMTSANQTLMFNLYQDIGKWGGFKPYISGGVGLAVRTTKYSHTETVKCSGAHTYIDPFTGSPGTETGYGCLKAGDATTSNGVTNGYGVALAVGTGFAYTISQGLNLDVGYRYLWQTQNMSLATPGGLNGTRIKFDSLGEHEITTGLRLDLE